MASSWLLIETLDQSSSSVIAQGSSVKSMVPVEVFFKRSRHKDEILALIETVRETATAQLIDLSGDRVAMTEPICNDWGQVHGLWLRVADRDEPEVNHGRAWAFVWNLTRGIVTRSKGLVPAGSDEEREHREWTIAEAFAVLETGSDATETLVKIINAEPGTKHQTTWPQKRPDGTVHDVNFAVRILLDYPPDSTAAGEKERILRGISNDLGDAVQHDDPESPIMLADLVAATAAEPGEYRAIVDLQSLRLLRWYGEPCPDLVWQYDELRRRREAPIHPDDTEILKRMQRDLDSGRAVGRIRFLTHADGYQPYDVIAKIVLLNRATTAALVTIRASRRG